MQFKKLNGLGLSLLLAISGALASTTGNVKVVVTDQSGAGLPGAMVSASSEDSLTKRQGVTDENGTVLLNALTPSHKWEIVTTMTGFATSKNQNVIVSIGKTVTLNVKLSPSEVSEELIVTGERPVVDTTSATVGQDITLELTEALPTGRSFQTYLQLASTTKPTSGENSNPSSKSGVNYSDIGGEYGSSSDNVYYIDGVNITDPEAGTSGSNFNSEIIQEQHVLTGGIAAEFEGGSGLVSQVVTKSGGNQFSGSINYYFQNDSLVADDENRPGAQFSNFDSAFTLGGPIIKDKFWFFISYQRKEFDDDVFDQDGVFQRSVNRSDDLTFAKLTYQFSPTDTVALQYFGDPSERDGSDDPTVLSTRDRARKTGGDNLKLSYEKLIGNAIIGLDYATHEGEFSSLPSDTSTRNDIIFAGNAGASLEQRSLGGRGSSLVTFANRDQFNGSVEFLVDSNFGHHTIKTGFGWQETEYKENSLTTGDGAQYTSLASQYSGTTLGQLTVSDNWTQGAISNDDMGRILGGIENSSDRAYFVGLLDASGDGSVSEDELRAYQFTSNAGNPNSALNVYRSWMSTQAPYSVKSRGMSFYVQDKIEINKWAFNVGIRAEEWKHTASDGSEVFTFDWEMAPRLSVSYDVFGDGRQKAFAFYGRYYDPVRNNMTDFAGALTGPVREEQIFLGDRWLTYRTRGGAVVLDSIFAPSTKTPYTDEMMLGYAVDFGNNMSLEAVFTDRQTRDILEDYDYNLYLDAGDFSLGPDYYGISDQATLDALTNHDINYIIATLAGGKRDYQGLELSFRKRMSNNWQMLASYVYNDAQGNSNSDSNADFQGDWVALDPRAPNIYGDQPGNIEHLLKVFGSYRFDNGLELGGAYQWNSGTLYSKTFLLYRRHLPLMDDPYVSGGYEDTYVSEGAIGGNETEAYGTLDLRLKYSMNFSRYKAEFFVDLFNALDDQAAIRNQDLASGDGEYNFGQANDWVDPRRFYLGARLNF
jgi:hypothetical protein